jgi:hypothetical protein
MDEAIADAETASRYRLRAAQLRRIADGVSGNEGEQLLRCARDYEDMAAALEELGATA